MGCSSFKKYPMFPSWAAVWISAPAWLPPGAAGDLELLLPLLPLLHCVTWLAKGLRCVPSWELAFSGTEHPHPFPHRGCPCSPLPAASTWHGYPVQCITWSDMRDSMSRKEVNPKAGKKYIKTLQCLWVRLKQVTDDRQCNKEPSQ